MNGTRYVIVVPFFANVLKATKEHHLSAQHNWKHSQSIPAKMRRKMINANPDSQTVPAATDQTQRKATEPALQRSNS